jgi:uncharacterized protein YdhG (YjbR/CyaY superfamily)
VRVEGVKSIDEYIGMQNLEVRTKLEQLREIVRQAAPEAEEVISYQMPAFKYLGMLVYFAAAKNHIGFYPGASGVENFRDELVGYKTSKGTVRFSLDEDLPKGLIKKIVKFRVKENEAKEVLRRNKKKKL